MKNLLTVDELAAELRVPKTWVYSRTRLFGKNQIPHIKVGKYCRFNLDEVLGWLAAQQEEEDAA